MIWEQIQLCMINTELVSEKAKALQELCRVQGRA